MNWKNIIKFVVNNVYWIVPTIKSLFKKKKVITLKTNEDGKSKECN